MKWNRFSYSSLSLSLFLYFRIRSLLNSSPSILPYLSASALLLSSPFFVVLHLPSLSSPFSCSFSLSLCRPPFPLSLFLLPLSPSPFSLSFYLCLFLYLFIFSLSFSPFHFPGFLFSSGLAHSTLCLHLSHMTWVPTPTHVNPVRKQCWFLYLFHSLKG